MFTESRTAQQKILKNETINTEIMEAGEFYPAEELVLS